MADYGSVLQHSFEKRENPQAYDMTPFVYVNPEPQRPILGIVGGNNVSLTKGNRVDLESDLLGITRPNTWCPGREYHPVSSDAKSITVQNTKTDIKIDIRPQHLAPYQMWAYPATFAPAPLDKQTCGRPEKY